MVTFTPPPPVGGPTQVIDPAPMGYTDLDIPENLVGFAPEPLRSGIGSEAENFLRAQSFTPLGAVGRYGQRRYSPPAGTAAPFNFAPSLFTSITDPALRDWIRYLFGERGYTTRIARPGMP